MTQDTANSFFSHLQSDYAAWLSQIVMASFYDDLASRKQISPPQSLRQVTDTGIPIPSRVMDSQDILHDVAQKILNHDGPAPREDLETFLLACEGFQNTLQRLVQDALLADNGVDVLTGFRSKSAMMEDLERELERRARRGQPFAISLSRIDGETARKNQDNILLAARAIGKTIRNFDDVYVTGDGEFLASLKHADNAGGLKFIVRLTEALKSDSDVNFTMSSCVAEPLPGDDLIQLLANVRKDLDTISREEEGGAGQYKDVSPLSRYIQSLKSDT